MTRRSSLALTLSTALGVALASLAARGEPDERSPATLLFERHCLECHSGEEPDGALDLSQAARLDSSTWTTLWAKVSGGSMPPKDHRGSRPSGDEIASLGSWLALQGIVTAPPLPLAGAGLRCLTRAEYERCVADLLDVRSRPARDWPNDEVADGFDTSTAAGGISPAFFRRALETAERVAEEAVLVFTPLRTRIPAGELELPQRAERLPRGYVLLVTNGRMLARINAPHAGRYTIQLRVFGDQAGPEAVRVGVYVDDVRQGTRETKARRSSPETLSFTVPLEAGARRVEVAFLNDYYRPEAPVGDRDRNFALNWIEVSGPLDRPPLPRGHARLVAEALEPEAAGSGLSWENLARVVESLATRAYRRPLTLAELARLSALTAPLRAEGASPEAGLRLALTAILASPHFLLRTDLDPLPGAGARASALSSEHLAARLSFFLWGSLPDDALRSAARAGTLRRELRRHAERLLDDPRASALVEEFGAQWLQLRRLAEASPDDVAYPNFDEGLRSAMQSETELVLEAILREDRPAHEVLDGRFTFINGRLSEHYGWGGVSGERFRRVELPPERSGVLTHASVLTLTSEPERASLVKRGKWLLEVILADPPPAPPPGADSLSAAAKARPDLPFAERLALHRTQADCRSCHARMDPLGIALERFDGTGARRRDAEQVSERGLLPDGSVIEGVAGLRTALQARRAQFLAGLGRALLIYALGRPLIASEVSEVEAIVASLGEETGLRRLVLALVESHTFTQAWSRADPTRRPL